MHSAHADDDNEPLELDAGMLHPEVDFEKGMAVFPPLSALLIVVCTAVFVLQVVQRALDDLDGLIRVGALHGPRVADGEVWRLLSAVFLHGSLDHLLGNLVMLYVLGVACEHAYGRWQFVPLFVFAGISGSLLSLTAGHTSVGASGAIFGLMGAIIVFFRRHRHRLRLRDKRIGFVLALWAVYQGALGWFVPGVDNLAHLGGLLGGAALGLVLQPAVLDGKGKAASHPLTVAGLVLALFFLVATACFMIPRLFA